MNNLFFLCFKGNWVINFHWIDVVVYSVSENLFSSNFVEKKNWLQRIK